MRVVSTLGELDVIWRHSTMFLFLVSLQTPSWERAALAHGIQSAPA